MTDKNLINFGDLSKPAVVFIEKIADAIGGYYKPYQMKRIAQAEHDIAIIRKETDLQIDEANRRAANRLLKTETKKQLNVESIASKAIPLIENSSKPEELNENWILDFFDKCSFVTDEQLQTIWATLLASEANAPGSIRKRTIRILENLEQDEARLFHLVCQFIWNVQGNFAPIIFPSDSFYQMHGIGLHSLDVLAEAGLLEHAFGGWGLRCHPMGRAHYFGNVVDVYYPTHGSILSFGEYKLTNSGIELACVIGAEPNWMFYDFIMSKWMNDGFILNNIWPRVPRLTDSRRTPHSIYNNRMKSHGPMPTE